MTIDGVVAGIAILSLNNPGTRSSTKCGPWEPKFLSHFAAETFFYSILNHLNHAAWFSEVSTHQLSSRFLLVLSCVDCVIRL
jgi:hypothetical protein